MYLFTAKTPLLYREEIIGPIPYQEIIYAHEIPFNVESGAEEEDLQIKPSSKTTLDSSTLAHSFLWLEIPKKEIQFT